MLLPSKKFIGLKAETKSGQALGYIHDFEIDENLEIQKIYVKPQGLIKGLVQGDLIISKKMVISVEEEKIIVEDLKEGEFVKAVPEGSPAV